MMIEGEKKINSRRKTRQVYCGDVLIGGGAPVSVQSMTNTDTRDVPATVRQIASLAEVGCDIVRCAVPDESAANALANIKVELNRRGILIPIVADIHFDYRLAIAAIESGADKIRINPGNIGDDDRVRAVVDCAKDAGIPIRIGVNGGSLERDIAAHHGGATAEALCESALRNADRVGSMGFEDIVISVKSSDVRTGIETLRLLSERTDFPLHIGVTEAGAGERALMKSAIGIGSLLADGIGDTIRVSLTGDPVREIYAARGILASLGILPGAIDVISCPTCGRCKVDLPRIVAEVQTAVNEIENDRIKAARGKIYAQRRNRDSALDKDSVVTDVMSGGAARENRFAHKAFTVAVMGCAVNGPGEAAGADIGVACGDGNAVLFENGVKVKSLNDGEIVQELIKRISDMP
ncbi:MAG: flavodoxin-dependent (E)-4-hydroxy-3-methylbut-2-enyl-diphosphate synthase [Clostridiales Family XIII bacterium]|jgi:(E)-4-hydroxy-3-methylbut-2-enyl-diphosphate synthase|nr:flavodoxin-dependent (E)-4-hydroxy-3-methylbut-2-enyl-diphosphate synthase [Clostridiales Family XIII bacterium]